ncbi:MAG: protein kinase (serine/threonine-protein kinase)-like protein [Ramlibacter sp.]|nr:protein kinase (serine/threonine-protein kinase)-like protein [Ramlibacter sp.]
MTVPFTHLGRYRIERELGRGAMGVVWLAHDDALQRPVAIKTLLLPDKAGEAQQLEARFRQEAKAAGGLNHPNVITIYDLGREGDWLYIAMEVLHGKELRDLMAEGLLPLDRALDIAGQIASGLAAAHARGIVHRDVKPGNIMVLPDGHAKIMDFGIARMQQSDVRTQTGTMMGSPKYMSPEQVGGHAVDQRSDIFSLGSLLYETVTGAAAFTGANLGQLLQAILHGAPIPPSQVNARVPAAVEQVIARAMQKNEAARYQDAGEMAQDLARCRAALQRAVTETTGIDLFIGTMPQGQGVVPGFAPSRHFDSSAALQRLLRREAAAAAAGSGSARLARIGWTLAYLVVAAAAASIAFTSVIPG